MYPHGVPEGEQSPEEITRGWRCEDTSESNSLVFDLDGVPPALIDSLEENDSGNTVLSISAATRVMNKPQGIGGGQGNGGQAMAIADASTFSANNEDDKIKVLPGATISLIRGINRRDLQEQNGRKLITSTGTKRVLVVRIKDTVSLGTP